MRKVVFAAMSTLSGLVLLFSYHTSTNKTESTESLATGDTAAEAPAAEPESTAKGTANGAAKDKGATTDAAPKTYTGTVSSTPYGDVKVQITVLKDKITKSAAVTAPSDNPRDVSITKDSVPKLNAQTVSLQSAKLDIVSGATETSEGYAKSLQSAIDQAFK